MNIVFIFEAVGRTAKCITDYFSKEMRRRKTDVKLIRRVEVGTE